MADGHQARANCEAIQTRSIDNHFLPADYIADLETFTGIARARYVEGKWAGSEGLVYDRWERSKFVMERSGPWRRILVGQDEGYTNPAVLLVAGEDEDGRLHIFREWYRSKQLETDVVAEAKAIEAEFAPEAFILDPSAAKLRARMQAEGLFVQTAENDVFAGSQAVQKRLIVAGDGRPRLTVDPSCENTIREFETYEWKQQTKARGGGPKDEPVKSNDHAMDALRYMIAYVDGLNFGGVQFRILGERSVAETEHSDDDADTLVSAIAESHARFLRCEDEDD